MIRYINKMTKIVVVDKNCNIKDVNVKNLTREIIYKKCNFRKKEGFERRTTWNIDNFDIDKVELWTRDAGKSGQENKYELPPPVDSSLYFGSIALVACDEDGDLIDLSKETWKKIYDHLFGGFDDLDAENTDEESEDELEDVDKSLKSKVGGYLKDGFIVDVVEDESDNDMPDENEILELPEEDYSDEEYLSDMGSELEEEDYYYSDSD